MKAKNSRPFVFLVCILAGLVLSTCSMGEQSAMDQFNSVYGPAGNGNAANAAAGTIPLARMEANGRKLDIVGVYPGMAAKAAIAAVQAHNRQLSAQPHAFKMSDVPDQTFTASILFRIMSGDAAEGMTLELSMQPMESRVIGVSRWVMYTENNVPTIAASVAALRSKYGHESYESPKDPTGTTNYVWVVDETGKLLSGTQGSAVAQGCFFVSGTDYTRADIVSGFDGRIGGTDCSRYTGLRAELTEWDVRRKTSRGQSEPPGMLFQLRLSSRSVPLEIASSEATRKMLFAARQAQQDQQKKAAGKRVPVL